MSSLPEPTGDRRTVLPARRDAGTPPPATPPKSYSVDEMLTQLRAPEGKMRRRRTEQPVYASRRRRRLVIGLTLGLTTLALGGYYGFRFFQRLRLEGETFRETLNRRVSDAVGCQIELTRIYDGGRGSLSAREGRFDTTDQDLIESGSFAELNASLTPTSWTTNEWGIEQLSIAEGTISLNPNRAPFPADSTRWVPSTAARERHGREFRSSISPDPEIITLDSIRVTKSLNLEWPSASPDRKSESIRGLKGHAKFPPGGGMEGALIGGTVVLNLLPEFHLEHVQWKLTGRKLEIPGARIVFGGEARAEITGQANIVSDGGIDLTVNFVSTPLRSLLPAVWHERVLGKFAATGTTFHATFGKGPERVIEGDFSVTGAVLRGIAFVNKLADALQRPDLTFLEFPELTGHFKWSPSGGMEITSLSADKEGIIRLAGSVSVTAEGNVSGQLKASVSDALLRSRTRPDIPHPFLPSADGWSSVDLTLSGTSATIKDSLVLPDVADGSIVPNVTPGESPVRVPSPEPVRTPAAAPAPVPPVPPAPRPQPPATKKELEQKFNDLLPK